MHVRQVLCYDRSFFICKNGEYGVGNPGIEKGDLLVLLFPDVYMPFVLRRKGDYFEMVAIAYIPPAIRKETIETRHDQIEEFIIV